jgi:hypothetical protein
MDWPPVALRDADVRGLGDHGQARDQCEAMTAAVTRRRMRWLDDIYLDGPEEEGREASAIAVARRDFRAQQGCTGQRGKEVERSRHARRRDDRLDDECLAADHVSASHVQSDLEHLTRNRVHRAVRCLRDAQGARNPGETQRDQQSDGDAG